MQNYWQEETSYLIFGRRRPWDGERLDPVDNVGAFAHNCRDIRPVH